MQSTSRARPRNYLCPLNSSSARHKDSGQQTLNEKVVTTLTASIGAFGGQFHNDAEWQPLRLWCGNGNRPAIAAGDYRGYEPIQVSSLRSS